MLTTARLHLRAWRDADRNPFARMNADPAVTRFLPGPLSRDESDRLVERIEAHFREYGFGLFAAELRDGGHFAGFIGLSVPAFQAHFTPAVEIGWRLAPEFWNRGLATEGAREVARYAFGELGLEELVSFTVPANLASRRVMEKIGMRRDPKDDFDHPSFPAGHPLRRHVLCRLGRSEMRIPGRNETGITFR